MAKGKRTGGFFFTKMLTVSDVVRPKERCILKNRAGVEPMVVTTDDALGGDRNRGIRVNAVHGGTVLVVLSKSGNIGRSLDRVESSKKEGVVLKIRGIVESSVRGGSNIRSAGERDQIIRSDVVDRTGGGRG